MRVCSVEGCDNKVCARDLCEKHYRRLRRHGDVNHSCYDPNIFILEGSTYKFILRNEQNEEIAEVVIDSDDYNLVSQYKWHFSHGYVGSNRGGLLHRLIMNAKKGQCIDHKNRNKLDNRKQNLRFCTQTQNNANSGPRKRNKSGYKGVSFCERDRKWVAQICDKKSRIFLGNHTTARQAALAYNLAAERLFGEFAVFNQVF